MTGVTYKPDEIAKMFKISKHTVYEMIKRGELKAFKVGNKMRIEQGEVERFKESMQASPQKGASQHLNPISSTEHSLLLAGSHDFLVEHLIKYVTQQSNIIQVRPSYIGSLEGLMMLYRGGCDIAAVHLLDPASHQYNLPFIKQLFVHEEISVIRFASRQQGFIVGKDNPKGITSIKDLNRNDVTLINRQKGSGTRFLLDSMLAKEDIDPSSVKGYETEEWNHLSAASYVSRGIADVAFGIQSAASQLGLDFIPVAEEQFDLVFRWTDQNRFALEHLLDIIQVTSFKDSVLSLEGYDASNLGTIIFQHK